MTEQSEGLRKMVEQGLLFDYYGCLLTQQQQRLYQDAVCEDMSLSEISQLEGISRQAVSDQIQRTTKKLREYEEKLRLIEKFSAIRDLCDSRLSGDDSAGGHSAEELLADLRRIRSYIQD